MKIQITKAEFEDMYEKGEVIEVTVYNNKIFGRTSKHAGDYGLEFYIVWANL